MITFLKSIPAEGWAMTLCTFLMGGTLSLPDFNGRILLLLVLLVASVTLVSAAAKLMTAQLKNGLLLVAMLAVLLLCIGLSAGLYGVAGPWWLVALAAVVRFVALGMLGICIGWVLAACLNWGNAPIPILEQHLKKNYGRWPDEQIKD